MNVSTFSKGKAGCTENILCVTHIELKWPPQDSTAQTSCQVYFCTVVFVFVLFILERNVISHITFPMETLHWIGTTSLSTGKCISDIDKNVGWQILHELLGPTRNLKTACKSESV